MEFRCDEIGACRRYRAGLQDCALAANLEICLRIKVAKADLSQRFLCNEDGTLIDPPPDMPNSVQCAFSAAVSKSRDYFRWLQQSMLKMRGSQ